MSKPPRISKDEFESIAQRVSLSRDLKRATTIDKSEIGHAIFAKLSFSNDRFGEFVEEVKETAGEYVGQIVKPGVLGTTEQEHIASFSTILQNLTPLQARTFRGALNTLKEIEELSEEHSDGNYNFDELENDEITEKILDWVSTLNMIRAIDDIIPLVSRGIYTQKLKELLKAWQENRDESQPENFWQKLLSDNIEIFERVIGSKIILISDQANVGGSDIDGRGEKVSDFALENVSTNNTVLIEIKKPSSRLIGTPYRNNVYALSADLSGAISQVLVQRNELMHNFAAKKIKSRDSSFEAHKPKCIIISGDIEKELGDNLDKKRSFELQRGAMEPDVVIKTFDELFESFTSFNDAHAL